MWMNTTNKRIWKSGVKKLKILAVLKFLVSLEVNLQKIWYLKLMQHIDLLVNFELLVCLKREARE